MTTINPNLLSAAFTAALKKANQPLSQVHLVVAIDHFKGKASLLINHGYSTEKDLIEEAEVWVKHAIGKSSNNNMKLVAQALLEREGISDTETYLRGFFTSEHQTELEGLIGKLKVVSSGVVVGEELSWLRKIGLKFGDERIEGQTGLKFAKATGIGLGVVGIVDGARRVFTTSKDAEGKEGPRNMSRTLFGITEIVVGGGLGLYLGGVFHGKVGGVART